MKTFSIVVIVSGAQKLYTIKADSTSQVLSKLKMAYGSEFTIKSLKVESAS